MIPDLDPYPHGRPIGLVCAPTEMAALVTQICIRLSDILSASLFVIHPSKGEEYPILSLAASDGGKPRVVFFPGWEDNRRKTKSRIHFGRQSSLLLRLASAKVKGDPVHITIPDCGFEPLIQVVSATLDEWETLAVDLQERLGDLLLITLTEVHVGGLLVPVLRLYGPNRDLRLVLVPGWLSDEVGQGSVTAELLPNVMRIMERPGVVELPLNELYPYAQ